MALGEYGPLKKSSAFPVCHQQCANQYKGATPPNTIKPIPQKENGIRNQPSYRVKLMAHDETTASVLFRPVRATSSAANPARNTISVIGIEARYKTFGFRAKHASDTHAARRSPYTRLAVT